MLCVHWCFIDKVMSISIFITLNRFKWFLNTMCSHMSYKRRFFNKTFIRWITFEWLLCIMCSLMFYKDTSFRILFTTLISFKWLIPTVYSIMNCKVSFFSENFITLITRPLSQGDLKWSNTLSFYQFWLINLSNQIHHIYFLIDSVSGKLQLLIIQLKWINFIFDQIFWF